MGFFKKTGKYLAEKGKKYKEYEQGLREKKKRRLKEDIEMERDRLKLDKLKKQRESVRPRDSFFGPAQSDFFGTPKEQTKREDKPKKKRKKPKKPKIKYVYVEKPRR